MEELVLSHPIEPTDWCREPADSDDDVDSTRHRKGPACPTPDTAEQAHDVPNGRLGNVRAEDSVGTKNSWPHDDFERVEDVTSFTAIFNDKANRK